MSEAHFLYLMYVSSSLIPLLRNERERGLADGCGATRTHAKARGNVPGTETHRGARSPARTQSRDQNQPFLLPVSVGVSHLDAGRSASRPVIHGHVTAASHT